MQIELTESEVEVLKDLIRQSWLDGFDEEKLNTIFEKLGGDNG